MRRLGLHARVALAAAGLCLGCAADDVLPLDDLCTVSNGKEDAKTCLECDSDADCTIGGSPCCSDTLHWSCGHVDALAKLETCANTSCLAPPKPSADRCRCRSGRCKAE